MRDEAEQAVTFESEYCEWLCDISDDGCHGRLLDALHDIRFRWTVPDDEHRESDARHLRVRFEDVSGLVMPRDALEYPASFLEVCVSLSIIMDESIMHEADSNVGPADWFWLLMDNVGLSRYDDRWVEQEPNWIEKVRSITNRVMDRRYSPNGSGGFFPCPSAQTDLRDVGLWYQMNIYAIDNGWV